MRTTYILNDLVYYIQDKSSGLESVAKNMLKVAVEQLGSRTVAEITTTKLSTGEITDSFFLKWREEEYQKAVDLKEKEILEIIK